MATRTTSQTGTWPGSGTALWGGTAVPTSADDVVINHAVTIDGAAVCAGGAINAALTVDAADSLTVHGNVTQANATFTMGAGSTLAFDSTAGDITWTMGTANSQTSCKFLANGSSGSRCTVSKSGGNRAYFVAWGGWDTTGWDCTYTDFSGISNAAGTIGIQVNSFGACDHKLEQCTFDACGMIFAPVFDWGGASNKSYHVRDCKWTNTDSGASCLKVSIDSAAGSGTKEIVRNSFDRPVVFNALVDIEDNLFEFSWTYLGRVFTSLTGNLWRVPNGGNEVIVSSDTTDCYWLAGLDAPGNPHCFVPSANNLTFSGNIFEFPAAQGAASGECVYTIATGYTVTNNLALAGSDGYCIGAVAHHSTAGGGWTVNHNTAVGRDAQICTYEGSDPATPVHATIKSNLVADLSNNASALVLYDQFQPGAAVDDIVLAANATHNGKYQPAPFTDPITSGVYSGYKARFSSGTPGDNDITANPNFVDSTRNFQNWAVYKGAAASGDSQAVKTAAALALLRATPLLIRTDLIPWVKAGFAPTNATYQNAGHDGVTIGAVEYQAPAPTTSPSKTRMVRQAVNRASRY
jgi:hypothetical protein